MENTTFLFQSKCKTFLVSLKKSTILLQLIVLAGLVLYAEYKQKAVVFATAFYI